MRYLQSEVKIKKKFMIFIPRDFIWLGISLFIITFVICKTPMGGAFYLLLFQINMHFYLALGAKARLNVFNSEHKNSVKTAM